MIGQSEHEISIDLKSGLINGDVNAFENIYRFYFHRIFHFVNRFAVTREDTEEIVQDVFVKLWEKRASIDLDKNFSSFLFTIAQNMVIDRMRQYMAAEKRMQVYRVKNANKVSRRSTEELVNYYELSNLITELINDLPPRRRMVFKLNREKGMTYKEIADLLKVSQGTIEKQMSKAIHTLTSILKNNYGYNIELMVFFLLLFSL